MSKYGHYIHPPFKKLRPEVMVITILRENFDGIYLLCLPTRRSYPYKSHRTLTWSWCHFCICFTYFLTWDVCHITYYMFCMQLVWFHQGPSNTFYPQILNILTYFTIILYIMIHRKNLSPIYILLCRKCLVMTHL